MADDKEEYIQGSEPEEDCRYRRSRFRLKRDLHEIQSKLAHSKMVYSYWNTLLAASTT
jgi:hypothetical protein